MQRAEGWPDAVSLDVSSGIASPVLDDLVRSTASIPVLLLAVGPLAQRGGWAADACINLAEAFASRGQRVVVADLSLDGPELHDRLGTDNTEGLTDVFLFGASLEHVTRMLPAHSFELIPAAPFTPDTEEILTHRRWSVVFEEMAAGKARLLLYLPTTVAGTGALSDRVGHTIVLADRWEASAVIAELSVDADVMAYLSPPETPVDDVAIPAAEADEPTEPEHAAPAPRMADGDFDKIRLPKSSAREALIADLRARQRAALQAPAPAMAPLPVEVDIPRERAPAPVRGAAFPPAKASINEPGFASTVREKPRRRVLLPALVVVLLVSIAATFWHVWRGGSIAGFDRIRERPSAQAPRRPTAQTPAPAPAEPPMPAGRPLPYSVAIAGYQLMDQAQERVDQLRREQPSMQFFTAPTVVQGRLYYRVLAGPLPDSATAAAVRDTLMARRIKTMALASDLLVAPYAFLIGTFPRRSEAQAKAAEAAGRQIPTYVVPIADASGTTLYRVYAGAFSGQGDAEFLRDLLKSASLPDSLVERTGSIRS